MLSQKQIFENLLRHRGFNPTIMERTERWKVLGKLFHVQAGTIRQWERREYIPPEQIDALCEREGYSQDWVKYGIGKPYREQDRPVTEIPPHTRVLETIMEEHPKARQNLVEAANDPEVREAVVMILTLPPEKLRMLAHLLEGTTESRLGGTTESRE